MKMATESTRFSKISDSSETARRCWTCMSLQTVLFVDVCGSESETGIVQVVRYPRTTSEQTYCNSMAYFKQES